MSSLEQASPVVETGEPLSESMNSEKELPIDPLTEDQLDVIEAGVLDAFQKYIRLVEDQMDVE